MTTNSEFETNFLNAVRDCITLASDPQNFEDLLGRVESLSFTLWTVSDETNVPWAPTVNRKLEEIISIFSQMWIFCKDKHDKLGAQLLIFRFRQ